MAPEQLRGEKVDARTDVYAAGVVLYELATGRRPFPQARSPELIEAILLSTAPAPRTLDHRISEDLERILCKALERDPELRYQAAKELRVDLQRLSTPTARIAPLPVPRPRPKRWLTIVAPIVLLVAFLLFRPTRRIVARLLGGLSQTPVETLAVLPLENLSHDSEQDYFADGLTEEIITNLTKVGALRVISRSSIIGYRGSHKSMADIAKELKVEALVLGSVLRSGNRVRVTAQLIRPETGENIWAESYERDLRDVLALQSEVSRAIAHEVHVKLTPDEQKRLAVVRPLQPEAHDAYLQGRYWLNKYTQEGFGRARELFEKALAIDPGYAPAYSGIADSYYGASSIWSKPAEVMPRSRAAAMKAIELDETLAEAHVSLGVAKTVYDWDWPGAERELKRAIELNPGCAAAHQQYGYYLMAVGRSDEAIASYRRALDLDPLSLVISAQLGFAFYTARRYDAAVLQLRSTAALDSTFYYLLPFLGLAKAQTGDLEEAVSVLGRATRLVDNGQTLAQFGYVLARAGKQAEARRVLATLAERARRDFVPAYDVALVHIALGSTDQAFEWLSSAVEQHSEMLIMLKVDPALDPIRSDPRFGNMLRRVGLGS
jgi:TolB-like protein